MGKLRQRITLRVTSIIIDIFVSAGKHNRLKDNAGDLVQILDGEFDYRTNLIAIALSYDCDLEIRAQPGGGNIAKCFDLHVEEIADAAVAVFFIRNPIKLEIHATQPSSLSLQSEIWLLGKP